MVAVGHVPHITHVNIRCSHEEKRLQPASGITFGLGGNLSYSGFMGFWMLEEKKRKEDYSHRKCSNPPSALDCFTVGTSGLAWLFFVST